MIFQLNIKPEWRAVAGGGEAGGGGVFEGGVRDAAVWALVSAGPGGERVLGIAGVCADRVSVGESEEERDGGTEGRRDAGEKRGTEGRRHGGTQGEKRGTEGRRDEGTQGEKRGTEGRRDVGTQGEKRGTEVRRDEGTQGKKGARAAIQIYWQKPIRPADVAKLRRGEFVDFWYPYETQGGLMAESRLVLPVPPGVGWRDEMPVVLPEDLPGAERRAEEVRAIEAEGGGEGAGGEGCR